MTAQELQEVVAVEDEQRRLLEAHRARRPRAAVEQRQLAEDLSRFADREDDLRAGVVLDEQLDTARSDDVQRIAGLAERKDLLVRRKRAALEDAFEIRTFVVMSNEQRHRREAAVCICWFGVLFERGPMPENILLDEQASRRNTACASSLSDSEQVKPSRFSCAIETGRCNVIPRPPR
jgi:hypothetical protein